MRHKINVLLDLDQTLVSSEDLASFDMKKEHTKLNKFDYVVFLREYVIVARPGLQEFLDFLFANFNVSIWTAASREYALFIVQKLILVKPNRKIDFFFYSYHSKLSISKSNKIKDLSMLWTTFRLSGYNPKNTLVIDDNDEVYEAQPGNTFRIKEFQYKSRGSDKDTELYRIGQLISYIKR